MIIKYYFKAIILFSIVLFTTCDKSSKSSNEQNGQSLKKPNILFILVDDMGWNGLSCFGNPHVATPNIDRLAEQGMKFTSAYTAPECKPTRAEFLSGQYGARTKMTQVHTTRIYPNAILETPEVENKLPENNYTIANMLKDAGYITAISGKWHVGEADSETKKNKYGFDFVGEAEEKPWDQMDKDKATPGQTNDILQFIEQNKNHPFFAYLSYYNIHTPLQAPDSLVLKYVNRGYQESTYRFGIATEKPTAHILAMTDLLDKEIGNLIDGLEEMKVLDQTLIVFISDNGGLNRAWDNFPLRGAKGMLYEGGIKVPMLAHWPEIITAGSSTDVPVHIIDMYATFKEISGGTLPETKILDGESLLPLLTQKGKLNRETLYWHHPHYIHDYGKTPSSAIRQGNFKLIYYYGDYLDTHGYLPIENMPYGELIVGERIELFNIVDDPYEKTDLSLQNPEKANELLAQLKAWLKQMDAPLPWENENPNLDVWYKSATRN
jgi:arylsulfatase A